MTAQLNAAAQVREFTKQDWYGFAGAEAWPTSQPLIGHYEGWMVIADRNGIEVIDGRDEESPLTWYLPLITKPMLASLISNTILTALEATGIFDAEGLGFQPISF